MSLDAIGLKHGTDKASNFHNYLGVYQQYLQEFKVALIDDGDFLELGWFDGASMRMWREWWGETSWTITGMDIEPKDSIPGVNFFEGDQAHAGDIQSMSDTYGPWDIIVDDASHLSSLTIRSFKLLWPHLKPGGLYFIEDLHVSYHHDWQGNPNPLRPGPGGDTSMQFFKRLADSVHFGHAGAGPAEGHTLYAGQIDHVAFWPGLCVVRKTS